MDKVKIKSVPMGFHCEGMMEIIKQLILQNMKNCPIKGELPMLLNEYGKFWYYKNIKGYKGVDTNGKELT